MVAGAGLALAFSPAWAEEAVAVDAPAPNEVGIDAHGDPVRIEDGLGKIQFIGFWATWCGYCKQQLPVLEGLARRLGPENGRVLLLTSEDRDVYRKVVRLGKEMSVQFVHDPQAKVGKRWGVHSYPHLFLVGHDGVVLKALKGWGDASTEELVGEVNVALTRRDQGAARKS